MSSILVVLFNVTDPIVREDRLIGRILDDIAWRLKMSRKIIKS